MSNNGPQGNGPQGDAQGRADASGRGRTRPAHKAGAQGAPPADEMLYCERCGISFLWTVEEQRRRDGEAPPAAGVEAAREEDAGAPVRPPRHCPGCRVLLPPPARERGLVKWYNIRKRYGFLVRHNQPDIFVPAASLRGTRFLQTGDLVEFSVGANAEGPVAEDVRVLAPGAQPAS